MQAVSSIYEINKRSTSIQLTFKFASMKTKLRSKMVKKKVLEIYTKLMYPKSMLQCIFKSFADCSFM
jgi:hypothetical protein